MVMERASIFGFGALKSRSVAMVVGWALLISLLMIKNHQLFYMENDRFAVYRIAYDKQSGPMFGDLDWVILLASSFLVGIFLSDAKKMVYIYFAVVALSFIIGTIYVYIYNWFVLDLGQMMASVPFGWEYALYIAFLSILRFMFPLGMFACLVGLATGSFIAVWARIG